MVGVSRPSSKQIIENIHNNILFFRNTYPQHIFDCIVCTYINENYKDVLNYCEENKIMNYFIEPIKDSDIPKKLDKYITRDSPDILSKNRYRMFYSMNYIINKIPNIYDGIIRLRIDAEIKSFELFDSIKPNVYYTVMDKNDFCSDNIYCSDNIGYAKLEVMKKVWDLKNCFIRAINSEVLVYNAIKKNLYSIEQFKFHYILYQDNSEFFDGIKQWSRRNREWTYDGNTYSKG